MKLEHYAGAVAIMVMICAGYGYSKNRRAVSTIAPTSCAKGKEPFILNGKLLDGQNRPGLARAPQKWIRFGRTYCLDPKGDWAKYPLAPSKDARLCGGVSDANGTDVFENGQRLFLCHIEKITSPPPTTRTVGWFLEGTTGAICQQDTRFTVSPNGSASTTLKMTWTQDCVDGHHSSETQTVNINAPTVEPCSIQHTDTCTIVKSYTCASNGSTTFCPEN